VADEYPAQLLENLRQALVIALEEDGMPADGEVLVVSNAQLGTTVIELTPPE
jgi:hypothetical protein